MSAREARFDDGEAYERFMGPWSRLAGDVFLDWLRPEPGGRWLDVGCGNGAFTTLLFERAGAARVDGIDPSPGQLAFAETRLRGRNVGLQPGSAAALPFGDDGFDAAVMALVIFFVSEPARGVAEMVRVVRPGGTVCAYAWDVLGGGFPTEPVADALRAVGLDPPRPPVAEASTTAALRALWEGAGLENVSTHDIVVERTFDGFAEWWESCRAAPSLAARIDGLPPAEIDRLQRLARERLPPGSDGRIRTRARANAVRGTKSGNAR